MNFFPFLIIVSVVFPVELLFPPLSYPPLLLPAAFILTIEPTAPTTALAPGDQGDQGVGSIDHFSVSE